MLPWGASLQIIFNHVTRGMITLVSLKQAGKNEV